MKSHEDSVLRIHLFTAPIFRVSAPGEYREEQSSTRQYATHHIQKKYNPFCIASTVDKIRFPNSPRQNAEYNRHRQAVENAGNKTHRQRLMIDRFRKVAHIQEECESCEKQVNNRDKDAIGDRIRIHAFKRNCTDKPGKNTTAENNKGTGDLFDVCHDCYKRFCQGQHRNKAHPRVSGNQSLNCGIRIAQN